MNRSGGGDYVDKHVIFFLILNIFKRLPATCPFPRGPRSTCQDQVCGQVWALGQLGLCSGVQQRYSCYQPEFSSLGERPRPARSGAPCWLRSAPQTTHVSLTFSRDRTSHCSRVSSLTSLLPSAGESSYFLPSKVRVFDRVRVCLLIGFSPKKRIS